MRAISTFAVAALLFSVAAAAQVIHYSDWAEGPVKHLMTKEEMKQWKALRSDKEAAAFIDLFWARRDPTSDTPRNEFREIFKMRVEMADKQFSSTHLRGALSDPGKVLILLGQPWQMSSKGAVTSKSSFTNSLAPPTDAEGNLTVNSPRGTPRQQVWTYAHEHKPKFIKQNEVVLLFSEEGINEWQLAFTDRSNPTAILNQAVQGLIFSPNLTAPRFPNAPGSESRVTSFTDSSLNEAYRQFRSGDKTAIGPANLTWGEFVTSGGDNFVSIQLYVPSGGEIKAGQNVKYFDVIENQAGEIVQVDENPVMMNASGSDAYVDASLQLQPGTYTAVFGLAADGRVVAMNRASLTVDVLDPAVAAVSPLILSTDIHPHQADYAPTDPFIFGGLKVVPKGDLLFAPKGDLWYFLELRNPGTKGGAPGVQVQVDIAGKTSKGPAHMKLPMQAAEMTKLKGENERYGVGLAIPLEGFIPGEYTMKLRLVDTILHKEYQLEKGFRVQ